ncbi:hypothetical protein [Bacillus sinesaloumensis]|uniref:hypothetical protein n=1 Tax=Litchfieldia sinesaloumensis TaxID=1926280 RepID=UPI0009883AF0|nr:hypothetical protein [Bacillus sinesaloumensis]
MEFEGGLAPFYDKEGICMFHPTVFDNLKVVIEGALYDLDLEGPLLIINRQDLVEMARLGRNYRIIFKDKSIDNIQAYIDLRIDLDNLLTDLRRPDTQSPGCRLEIGFIFKMDSLDVCPKLEAVLSAIWGDTRDIQQEISFQHGVNEYTNNSKIIFHRLIYEDNIDDLLEMIDYMIDSIHQLHKAIS